MKRMTRYITRPIWLLSLVSLFSDITSEMIYPIMPIYLQSIGFSIVWIGTLEGIAEAIAEATIMQVQQSTGTGGFWMDAVRNTLGDWLSPKNDSGFVGGIEKQIEDKICGYWNKATGNAKNVLTKLNGEKQAQSTQTATQTTSPSAGTTAVFPTGK